ncbi:MAG: hypothetical protein NTW48_01980 [Chloroflexi bacterium]|nr:hypothetical protein [Chloroflexota bacterium]
MALEKLKETDMAAAAAISVSYSKALNFIALIVLSLAFSLAVPK